MCLTCRALHQAPEHHPSQERHNRRWCRPVVPTLTETMTSSRSAFFAVDPAAASPPSPTADCCPGCCGPWAAERLHLLTRRTRRSPLAADRRRRPLASPPPHPLAHARLRALCPVSRHWRICNRRVRRSDARHVTRGHGQSKVGRSSERVTLGMKRTVLSFPPSY